MNSIISHRGTYDSENTSLESIKNCVEKDIGILIKNNNDQKVVIEEIENFNNKQ